MIPQALFCRTASPFANTFSLLSLPCLFHRSDTASGLYRRPADRACSASACQPPCGFRVSPKQSSAQNAEHSFGPPDNAPTCLGRRAPCIASRGVSRAPSEPRDQKEISEMATTTVVAPPQNGFTNQILHGDCIEVMRQMPANSVDFILTDPPYLVNYRGRSGRTIQNDVDE